MQASTLRQRRADLTREAIRNALIGLISKGGVADFSVQSVADAAGVAHRTVYRHYPNREALLEGLGEWLNERFVEALGYTPGTAEPDIAPEEVGRVAEAGYRIFDDNHDLVVAYVILSIGARLRLKRRVRNTQWLARVLAPRTEHLSKADATAVATVVRVLASSVSWHLASEHSNTRPDALARGVRWAIDTLVADLAAGGGPRKES